MRVNLRSTPFKRLNQLVPFQTIWMIAVFLSLTLMIHYFPRIFQSIVQLPIQFDQISDLEWKADLTNLSPGKYYVSAGRPQGVCTLLLDNRVIDSNEGDTPEVRTHLLIGAGFTLNSENRHRSIIFKCLPQAGFFTFLYHQPTISHFVPGMILQLIRGFIDIYLGPISGFILLFSSFLMGLQIRNRLNLRFSFYFFSVVALLYTISLSHFLSLFVPAIPYTEIHIYLRYLFSLTFILLCRSYSKRGDFLVAIHLLGFIVILYLAYYSPHLLARFYHGTFFVFSLSTGISAYNLMTLKQIPRFLLGLSSISAAWAILQFWDAYTLLYGNGPFTNTYMISVITGYLTYLKYRETLLFEREAQALSKELEIKDKVTHLTRQIAHDIKSPITLLNTILYDEALPTDMKELLRLSSLRLKGIANQTLNLSGQIFRDHSHYSSQVFQPSFEKFAPVSLVNHLKQAVLEKEKVHEDNQSIQFKILVPDDLLNVTVFAQATEFDRILSNLLNNSIEAIHDSGTISVMLEIQEDMARIQVQDSGVGIPADILKEIGSPGKTFGKSNGNGLGLYHAKNTIEYWQGKLEISSEEGKGTTVTLLIPLANRSASNQLLTNRPVS